MFSGVEKGCVENKWVNRNMHLYLLEKPKYTTDV